MMEKKDRKICVIVVCVLIVLLLLVLIIKIVDNNKNTSSIIDNSKVKGLFFSDEMVDDPNRVEISGKKLSKEQCYDNFCVSKVKILCYENSGVVEYVIRNTGKKTKRAYLKIVIGDYNGYIVTKKLVPGKKYKGRIGYEGYDLRKTKSYKLKVMSYGERDAIVK